MEALAENETKEEVEARQENIDEFMNKITAMRNRPEGDFSEMQTDRENPQAAPTLSGFLEEVALIADIDNLDQDGNQVMLMTLPQRKGAGISDCIHDRTGRRTVPKLHDDYVR